MRTLSFAAGACSLLGCSAVQVELGGRQCRDGVCVDGYECHPITNTCVVSLVRSCDGEGVCWSDTQTGDPCIAPDAFLPCGPGTDCALGCRTCTGGFWTACDGGDDACNETCNAQYGDPPNVSAWQCEGGQCSIFACVPGTTSTGDPARGCDQPCTGSNGGMEICDDADNDCNGLVDEGFGAGVACGLGACAGGRTECAPDQTSVRCSTEAGGSNDQSAPERCDPVDHDCDGSPVNGYDIGSACGVGGCAGGSWECLPNGSGVRCSTMPGGSASASVPELCDTIDRDCDGDPDNGFMVGTGCGAGACSGGAVECDGAGGVRCSTEAGGSAEASSPERCDATDHDCDGAPTNGFGVGSPCGQGECAGGALECTGDGSGSVCSTGPGGSSDMSGPEQCDLLDHDCDGDPHNGIATAMETCNGADDDCDGLVDEICPPGFLSITTSSPVTVGMALSIDVDLDGYTLGLPDLTCSVERSTLHGPVAVDGDVDGGWSVFVDSEFKGWRDNFPGSCPNSGDFFKFVKKKAAYRELGAPLDATGYSDIRVEFVAAYREVPAGEPTQNLELLACCGPACTPAEVVGTVLNRNNMGGTDECTSYSFALPSTYDGCADLMLRFATPFFDNNGAAAVDDIRVAGELDLTPITHAGTGNYTTSATANIPTTVDLTCVWDDGMNPSHMGIAPLSFLP